MNYIWQLKNPSIFFIFLSFIVFYGILYKIIIPIILRNKKIQGFTFHKIVYLVRFLSSFLFFFIIIYVSRILLKTKLTESGIRLSFPFVGLILYIIILPILIKYAKYQSNKFSSNLNLKSSDLSWKGIIRILISWLFYITGYEMLYRGILLYSLVPIIGKWEGITVITSIYFFDHISRDYYIALGAFLIGFVFGYIVLLRNSVFESITLHYLIAITTDIIILLKSKKIPA